MESLKSDLVLQVWVKRCHREIAYEAWTGTDYFAITGSSARIHGLKVETLGDAVQWNVEASGGVGRLQYKYWIFDQEKGWSSTFYTPDNFFRWTPPHDGFFSLRVWVRSANSQQNYETSEEIGSFTVTRNPVSISPQSKQLNDAEWWAVHANHIRTQLIKKIWNAEFLPNSFPDRIKANIVLNDRFRLLKDVVKSYDLHVVEMAGFTSFNHYFHSQGKKILGLAIVHQGHEDDVTAGNVLTTIKFFLKKDYDVIYSEMPLFGENLGPDVGWTTTLYSAIDPRISLSFPVAGSFPIVARLPPEMADRENYDASIYNQFPYTTLYALGAYGLGRKQIQVLNEKDSCCFWYWRANADIISSYVQQVRNYLGDSESGEFHLVVDYGQTQHAISDFTLNNIVWPAIQ